MNAWAAVTVSQPPRGPGSQDEFVFHTKALTLTNSWGAQPAQATLTYVNSAGSYPAIADGASAKIESAWGHLMFGVVVRSLVNNTEAGRILEVTLQDLRIFLFHDQVYGLFNQVENRVVAGRRVRRYWHILPSDFDNGLKTFTDTPYTAAQIIQFLLKAPTVMSPWVASFNSTQTSLAVLGVDVRGKTLAAALVEVSERQGLVFRLASTASQPWLLLWARKGYGGSVAFPAGSRERRIGTALSGHPTRVRVLGGRNRYQLLNIPLIPDWNQAWNEYYDFRAFVNWVFDELAVRSNDEMPGIPAGTRYNAIPGDTEEVVGYFLARARANSITVAELDAIRTDKDFSDARLFHGRLRNDLPVRVYVDHILFRAFRPQSVSVNGRTVPLSSVRMVGEMLCGLEVPDLSAASNPIVYNPSKPAQAGNGLALVRGYSIGEEMFRLVDPKRFDVAAWLNAQKLWAPKPFQIDESSEDGGFVVFDSPLIRSEDLLVMENGYAVFRANPTIQVPEVVAALTFEVEPFSWWKPFKTVRGDLNHTESVSDLFGEFVANFGGAATELAFDDGMTASAKAEQICDGLLSGMYSYTSGGYERILAVGDAATQLSGVIDRVTYQMSDQGFKELVDFTHERSAATLMPSREFDRRTREKGLLQAEESARRETDSYRRAAQGLSQAPGFVRSLSDAIRGPVGAVQPAVEQPIKNGSGQLPTGTPLWREPAKAGGNGFSINTQAVMPSATSSGHSVFCGFTARQNEQATHPVPVQRLGVALGRVKGPVGAHAPLVQAPGHDYLVAKEDGNSDAPEAGIALRAVEGSGVALIEVEIGKAAGVAAGGGDAVWS